VSDCEDVAELCPYHWRGFTQKAKTRRPLWKGSNHYEQLLGRR